MLESIAAATSGTEVNWYKSRDDIVAGVEALYSAVRKREEDEQELLENIWEVIKFASELTGPAKLPIQAGVVGMFAPFAAIGIGYAEAADEIKRDRASMSFCEGLVMGVMAESADNVGDYFWQWSPTPNPAFPEAEKLAQYYNNAGIALGYAYGREVVLKNKSAGFWADLKGELDGPLGDPAEDNWGRREWIDFYITTGGAFYRGHVSE